MDGGSCTNALVIVVFMLSFNGKLNRVCTVTTVMSKCDAKQLIMRQSGRNGLNTQVGRFY